MTKSNRTLNRIILFVLGLVAIVVGLVIGAGVLPAVRDAIGPYVDIPRSLDVPASSLWIVAGVCLVVIVLALVWAREERTRWSTFVLAVAAFTVAVMGARSAQIWYGVGMLP